MIHSVDEIYDLLTWDGRYTAEENREREARGLVLARDVRYLFPFIQPLLPDGKSKSAWEGCAKVLAARSDEELDPYLYLLLEWLQDLNWPGAEIVLDRLSRLPSGMISEKLAFSKGQARMCGDEMWLVWLELLEKKLSEKENHA